MINQLADLINRILELEIQALDLAGKLMENGFAKSAETIIDAAQDLIQKVLEKAKTLRWQDAVEDAAALLQGLEELLFGYAEDSRLSILKEPIVTLAELVQGFRSYVQSLISNTQEFA